MFRARLCTLGVHFKTFTNQCATELLHSHAAQLRHAQPKNSPPVAPSSSEIILAVPRRSKRNKQHDGGKNDKAPFRERWNGRC